MKDIDYEFEQCRCACDNCTREETIDSTNYSNINDELRSYGWLIKKIDGEWYEFCCDKCYKKFCE